jgi:hypothetical protein
MMMGPTTSSTSNNGSFRAFDPFANASSGGGHHQMGAQSKPDIDSTLSNLVNNMEIAGKNPAWMSHPPPGGIPPPQTTNQPFGINGGGNPWPQQQQQQGPPGYGFSQQQQQPPQQSSSNPFGAPF